MRYVFFKFREDLFVQVARLLFVFVEPSSNAHDNALVFHIRDLMRCDLLLLSALLLVESEATCSLGYAD